MDWNNPIALDEMEEQRNKRRLRIGRLTFDCFHAKCDGERVRCEKGHVLHRDRATLGTEYVLKGNTSIICKHCLDFEG